MHQKNLALWQVPILLFKEIVELFSYLWLKEEQVWVEKSETNKNWNNDKETFCICADFQRNDSLKSGDFHEWKSPHKTAVDLNESNFKVEKI